MAPAQSVNSLAGQSQKRFPGFLVATLLPILILPFTELEGNLLQRMLLPLTTNLLVLQSIRIMPSMSQLHRHALFLVGGERLYRWLGLLAAIAMWLPFLSGRNAFGGWHGMILAVICSFYLLTAVRIIQLISQLEGINARSLCLGSAGYVHLGLTAGQVATFIQVAAPGSFKLGPMLPGEELVQRLTYYSFVTLGSIGYGDVLPATPAAEFFTVCLSIAGTLYVSLIIGLLLSRYINDQTSTIESSLEQDIRRAGGR
ncbi:MAG: two pore domain potassium channel family protein [Synechococcaceae bacterium WB9_2_170]|nr:two pore domain potassium channel family protein [Synechococcaceae bacterium WB9_2_170]